jgi:hypothetical protein
LKIRRARGSILSREGGSLSDQSQPTTAATLSRLPTTLAQFYQQQLAYWQGQLQALQSQLTMLMASPVESYSFSGGEGQQSAKRRDLQQVQKAVIFAERQYGYYWKKLYGYGNVNMSLRRK